MKTAHFLSPDINTSQDLSLAALDFTTSIGRERKVEMIIFEFSEAVSEVVTITLKTASNSGNSIQQEITLVAEKHYTFRPHGEFNLLAGDNVQVECTNDGGAGIAKITFKTSEM